MTTEEAIDDLEQIKDFLEDWNLDSEAIEYAIIALSKPKATMSMSSDMFSLTIREEDVIIKLIQENQELRQKIQELNNDHYRMP
jgi:DNA-binding transcriptional MerR regulator